jgi:hypothetical protein
MSCWSTTTRLKASAKTKEQLVGPDNNRAVAALLEILRDTPNTTAKDDEHEADMQVTACNAARGVIGEETVGRIGESSHAGTTREAIDVGDDETAEV